MSRKPEDAVHIGGFWIFGFLSVVLAVLKLTVVACWSWWRVVLPWLAYLGHNALYILAGLIWFHWLKNDERSRPQRTSTPESVTTLLRCYFSFCFWTTCCDVRKDKAGRFMFRGDSI
jgi:hypothetical protein